MPPRDWEPLEIPVSCAAPLLSRMSVDVHFVALRTHHYTRRLREAVLARRRYSLLRVNPRRCAALLLFQWHSRKTWAISAVELGQVGRIGGHGGRRMRGRRQREMVR